MDAGFDTVSSVACTAPISQVVFQPRAQLTDFNPDFKKNPKKSDVGLTRPIEILIHPLVSFTHNRMEQCSYSDFNPLCYIEPCKTYRFVSTTEIDVSLPAVIKRM